MGGEIIWHLTEIEKGFLRKGTLPTEYVGVLLPKIRVSWQRNKQGKGRNNAEKVLLLNKLPQLPGVYGRGRQGLLAKTGNSLGIVS